MGDADKMENNNGLNKIEVFFFSSLTEMQSAGKWTRTSLQVQGTTDLGYFSPFVLPFSRGLQDVCSSYSHGFHIFVSRKAEGIKKGTDFELNLSHEK